MVFGYLILWTVPAKYKGYLCKIRTMRKKQIFARAIEMDKEN